LIVEREESHRRLGLLLGGNGKERPTMHKGDRITIAVLVVLGVAAFVAIGVMTLIGAPEYLEFAVAMALFAAILVGSYLFVITPQKQREEERDAD
jgi:energy-converting hydrogenase Eha subunit C